MGQPRTSIPRSDTLRFEHLSFRTSGFTRLPFGVETVGDDLSYFLEVLQPILVVAAGAGLFVGVAKGVHAGILDAYHHRSCFRSGGSGLEHSCCCLHCQSLHDLPALFDFLSVCGIVRLDHDDTNDSCLLREGGARRCTDQQENYNGHCGISSHQKFLSLYLLKWVDHTGFGPGTWYVYGVGKSNLCAWTPAQDPRSLDFVRDDRISGRAELSSAGQVGTPAPT